MKLLEFKTYEDYIKSQRKTDRRKSSRIGFNPKEMDAIVLHLDFIPIAIMCHGARNGKEVDQFNRSTCSKTHAMGTDLFLKGHEWVIEWDFSKVKEEWIGQFDIVYSNALDHARDPTACVQVWLEQLTENGVLAIQWDTNHIKARGGDCFGASLDEYVTLLNTLGNVTDLLYIGRTRKGFLVDIIVKKK